MKKLILYSSILALALTGCRSARTVETAKTSDSTRATKSAKTTWTLPEGMSAITAPTLVSKPFGYNDLDYHTFPIYKMTYAMDRMDADTRGMDTSNTALWLTPEATFLVTARYQHSEMVFFNMPSTRLIVDNDTKEIYKPVQAIGLPMDTTFWVKGDVGQWNVFVIVYPPLPETCRNINIVTTTTKAQVPGCTGWTSPTQLFDISIDELVKNQAKFPKKITK